MTLLDLHPTPHETVVLTGATGFVGSHFVLHALRSRTNRVVAIVRGETHEAARGRLEQTLIEVAASYHEPVDAELFSRLHVVLGDLSEPLCGVGNSTLRELRGMRFSSFWNFAASLSFEDRARASIELANVTGTRHALHLAHALRPDRYNQISTAYTAGKTTGRISEVLHPIEGPFNNHYERTKCEGEHLVAQFCENHGVPYSILRPSIVVGPKRTLHPGGSDSGLYGFAREIRRLSDALQDVRGALRIVGEADAELNYVPVDELVSDIWDLHDQAYPQGPIYHLTSEASTTVAETMDAVARAAGVCSLEVHTSRPDDASPLERLFDRRAEFYAGYFKHGKHFDRAWGRCAEVTAVEVQSYVARYLAHRQAPNAVEPFERHTIRSRDGMPLCAYACGSESAPVLVLVNAFGTPVEFFSPLATVFKEDYRLISWESRGVPSAVGMLSPDTSGIAAHVEDLVAVMDHFGVEQADLLGFCTGADVALHFATTHPSRANRIVSANGALWAEGAHRTPFQRSLGQVMPNCALSASRASLYHGLIYGHASASGHRGAATALQVLLDNLDPALVHMTSLPFRSAELLHRYGQLMTAYHEDTTQGVVAVDAPLLVLTSDDDPIAHHAASISLARRVKSSKLRVLEGGGHFGIYNDPRAWDCVQGFLASTQTHDDARTDLIASVA